MVSDQPEFLTVDEAKNILRCHRETVLRYIRCGDLRAGWAGGGYRITRGAVDECMAMMAKRRLSTTQEGDQ
jgi:excisionase family DNA binding protein